MKKKIENIFIIIPINPWISASASSNRQISLFETLVNFFSRMNIFVFGAQLNKENMMPSVIQVLYLNNHKKINTSFISIRYHQYIGQFLEVNKLKRHIINQLPSQEEFVLWIDNSLLSSKVVDIVKRKYPKAIIFTEMSEFLDIHKYNKGNFLQRWQGDIKQKRFEKKVFHQLDGFALMTNTLMKHYHAFPNPQPKLLHLPMTVDLERFENIAPAEFQQPYIAFVGVMNDAKDGVSNLIKAFNSIKDQFLEHKVYLVGAWNYDTPIHLELIKSFGLEDRVFWMKEYSRDVIPSIIGNADLLALPRPDSKQAQGGFPTKLGEYLASGVPVCATTVGEIPDYLVDNESVFFAKPGSVESFSEAIDRALSNYENAKRVGLNGKKVAELEFNKDIQAKKLYDFLVKINEA